MAYLLWQTPPMEDAQGERTLPRGSYAHGKAVCIVQATPLKCNMYRVGMVKLCLCNGAVTDPDNIIHGNYLSADQLEVNRYIITGHDPSVMFSCTTRAHADILTVAGTPIVQSD